MAESASRISRSRSPMLLTWPALCLGLVLCGCGSQSRSPAIDFGAGDGVARTPTASDVEMSSSGQPAIVVEAVLPVDWFEDVTERSGINFVSRNGREAQRYFLIESFGGGVRHCRDHCRVRRRLLSGVEIQFEQSRRTVTSGRSKCRAQAQRSRAVIKIGDPCGWRQVPRSGSRAVSIAREARKLGRGPHTVRGAHPRNLS